MAREERWALRLGFFVAFVALLNFTGWLLDYKPLQRLLPGEPSMGLVTATCMMASGLLLTRLGYSGVERTSLHLELCIGIVYQCTLVAGAITLGRLDYGAVETGPPKLPSLTVALNIALVSMGMLMVFYGFPRRWVKCCLGAGLLISFSALIGRALGVAWLMGDWENLSRPMPLETAVLFVLLAIGCLLVEKMRCPKP